MAWRFLAAVVVLVPLLQSGGAGAGNLPCSTCPTIACAARQDHVLRTLRAGDGPDLGLHRHPRSATACFRARAATRWGMYLMRQIGRDGVYKSDLPDFMVFLDWKALPWHWTGSEYFVVQMLLVILVPGLLAFVFGFFAFRSRIKGVISRSSRRRSPCRDAAVLPQRDGLWRQQRLHRLQAHPRRANRDARMRVVLCVLTGSALVGFFLLSKWIIASKYGRVLQAIRDASRACAVHRLQHALVQAVDLDLLGRDVRHRRRALRAAGRHHQPGEMSPAASIEIAIWTAVGGRATLIGPIIGAFFVNGAKSYFTVAFPEYWLFSWALMFIGVTLFLPQGIVGLIRRLAAKTRREHARNDARPRKTAASAARNTAKHGSHSADGSGGQAAFGRVVGDEVDTVPRRHPLRRRHHGVVRRLSRAEQADAGHRRRRAALHHRPQRRRQDDDDGRHHQQDQARQRRVFFGSNIDLLRLRESEIAGRGIGRKFQKPTVFEQHGVREPRARAEDGPPRARRSCSPAERRTTKRPHRRDARY